MLRDFGRIRRDPLGFLVSCRERYGDVVSLPIPRAPVLLLSDPAGVAQVLRDSPRRWTKRTVQYTSLAAVTGEGLLTSDGETWRRHRRLVQPAFHRSTLGAVAEHTSVAARHVLDEWEGATRRTGAAVVDVDASMMQAALEIVGHALLGTDLRAEAARLVAAVLEALEVVVARARTPVPLPGWVPTPGNRRMARSVRTIDDTVRRVLASRRGRPAGGADLLDLLLAARDGDDALGDAGIRDEVVTMVVAGHETVASALGWTWWLLARHPEVQAAVAAEAEAAAVSGDVTERLSRLSLTRRVVEESLRLYPPAWVLSRRAATAEAVAGVDVPAGALVIISPFVVHRHPAAWADPARFDPGRFDVARPGVPCHAPRAAYLPFGAGPRQCIGRDFALVEATLLLAELARRFELRPLPGRRVDVDALVTLRPRGGLPLQVLAR